MQNVSMMNKKLVDLFPEILPAFNNEKIKKLRVTNVNMNRKPAILEIQLLCDELLPFSLIASLEKKFLDIIKISSVIIKIKFDIKMTVEEIVKNYFDSILYMVNCKVASSVGLFTNCTYKTKDNKVFIYLKTKGSEVLKYYECERLIEGVFLDLFSQKVEVEFVDLVVDGFVEVCTRAEEIRKPLSLLDVHKKNKEEICGVDSHNHFDSLSIVTNSRGQDLNDEYVVFDIETTGLNAQKNKITEIGAVKIRNCKIVDKFSALVNPQVPIPSFIVKLTGITNSMVKNAPVIEDVLPEFLNFVGDSVVVAHNASFDTGFIKVNAMRSGLKFKNTVLDTLQLSRCMFPELGRYKLNLVAKHLGVSLENHHRAVDDSKATAEILIKCFEILHRKGVATLDDIFK